jgi:F0F1-type ATP synthase delta subunit
MAIPKNKYRLYIDVTIESNEPLTAKQMKSVAKDIKQTYGKDGYLQSDLEGLGLSLVVKKLDTTVEVVG